MGVGWGVLVGKATLIGLLVVAAITAIILTLRPWFRRTVSNARYRAMADNSSMGALIADAVSLRVVEVNHTLQQRLGYTAGQLHRLTLSQVFVPSAPDLSHITDLVSNPESNRTLQLHQRSKDGSIVAVEATVHRWKHHGRALVALHTRDVTLSQKIESQLLEKQQHFDHLAHHDPLTGLPNRLYLAEHLPSAIAEAKRTGTLLAILFLDLDRFKHINDSRGHETGDKLLKTVAERLRDTVRGQDVVVRMGGDEFVVVLHSLQRVATVNELAGRINEALSKPVLVDGRALNTTVSIGVSLFPRDGTSMGELLRHSDTAMYQAKDRGRNNVQVFNPAMARKLRERVAIESVLRTALKDGTFDVHYQPIVDIESNKVRWLEALLRWKHPQQGYVLPDRFIEVAEDTGLIVPVGEFVLERIMRDLNQWRGAGVTPLPVAANISAVQLQRSNMYEKITSLCKAHGVNPRLLKVELTESTLLDGRSSQDASARQDVVAQLRQMGVEIAIDDFGTGYSSLSYLKQWRVDYLKIDRSFVRDLVTDASDLAIVRAIVAMARHLNLQVVAEGIEGWQQLDALRELGCHLAQGFLLSRPLPAAECLGLLKGLPLDLTVGGGEYARPNDLDVTSMLKALA